VAKEKRINDSETVVLDYMKELVENGEEDQEILDQIGEDGAWEYNCMSILLKLVRQGKV